MAAFIHLIPEQRTLACCRSHGLLTDLSRACLGRIRVVALVVGELEKREVSEEREGDLLTIHPEVDGRLRDVGRE